MGAVRLVASVVVIVAVVEVGEPLHEVAHQPGKQPRVPGPLDGGGADDPCPECTIIEAEVLDWFTAVCEDLVTVPM